MRSEIRGRTLEAVLVRLVLALAIWVGAVAAHRPLQDAYVALTRATGGTFVVALGAVSVLGVAGAAVVIVRTLVRRRAWRELAAVAALVGALAVSAAVGPTGGEVAHAFEYGAIAAVLGGPWPRALGGPVHPTRPPEILRPNPEIRESTIRSSSPTRRIPGFGLGVPGHSWGPWPPGLTWVVVSVAGLVDEAIEVGGRLPLLDSGDVLRDALGAAIVCVVLRGSDGPG